MHNRLFFPRTLLVSAAIFSASLCARADTYLYSGIFTNSSITSTFSFTNPFLITSPTLVTNLLTSSTTFGSVQSLCVSPGASLSTDVCPISESIRTNLGSSNFDQLFFSVPFNTVGVFTDKIGDGSLTITDLTPTSVTPEPSSLFLSITGLVGLCGVARRRFSVLAQRAGGQDD